ncbi:MAG: hypothetical protein ABR576_03090 [Thermoanaerobaculia bacterium]
MPEPGLSIPRGGARWPRPLTLAAFLAAGAILFVVSRGKWSDALTDSGREWIVPDALARGDLLYRDVVYWFGPLTPYFHAGVFRLLGSGFGALVAAGVLSAAACLAVLYLAMRRVTEQREALLWTALAIPALIFMPNAGGAILGMGFRIWHAATFALLAVWLAGSTLRPMKRSVLAGSLCALAGLCRTEWGLAALAAVWLVEFARGESARAALRGALLSGAGFLLLFAAGLGPFLWAAGARSVIHESHVLLTGLPPETRTFLLAYSHLPQWQRGLAELLYSTAMWAALWLLIELLVLRKTIPFARARRTAATILGLLPVLALTSFLGVSGAVFFGAAPLLCLGAAIVSRFAARDPRSASLLAFGLLGFVLSYRRPLHIGDLPYVAPPLLFAFVSAAGLLNLRMERRAADRDERRRLRTALAVALSLLVACVFLARVRQYRDRDRASVPIAGTRGLLSAPPAVAAEIEQLAGRIRRETGPEDGLVVFPEGELLNFLAGRRNPLRHKLYIPGYLSSTNESGVLRELASASPAAVVLWQRSTEEYGRSFFGMDYGRRIRSWLDVNYTMRPFHRKGAPAEASPRFWLGLRNDRGPRAEKRGGRP